MRFFLVARDRSTGEVRLVADVTYETRDEALAVLGDESASEEYSAYDLFVVDLDSVSPVVLYRAPVAAPAPPVELETEAAVEEPIADVWEAPLAGAAAEEAEEAAETTETAPEQPEEAAEEAEGAEEAPEVAEEVTEEPVAPAPEEGAGTGERTVEDIEGDLRAAEPAEEAAEAAAEELEEIVEPGPSGSLADALRAAASSMEESGVVAPPSVEEYASAGTVTVLEESVSEEVIPPSEEAEPAPAAMDAHPEMWPWEAEGASVAPADEPAQAEEPADTESVLAAIAAFGTPEEAEAAAAADEVAEEPEPAADATPAPYVPVGIEEAGMEEISLLTPADPSFELDGGMSPLELLAEETPLDVAAGGEPALSDEAAGSEPGLSDEVAEAAEAGDGKVYEPGEVDIATYTCDDCVYVETCPKNHQDGPSTCGAFQWKPV